MATASAESSLPRSTRVLLLVDFINPLDFPGAERLAPAAEEAAGATAKLKAALRSEGVPTIYANDNYGQWQSDFAALVSLCKSKPGASSHIASLLAPQADDITVLKPQHSAFFGSPLDLMLKKMGTQEIVLAGLATDICIQLTAMDGFLRDYRMRVPSDCTAAESTQDKKQALVYMERVLKCDVAPSAFIPVRGVV